MYLKTQDTSGGQPGSSPVRAEIIVHIFLLNLGCTCFTCCSISGLMLYMQQQLACLRLRRLYKVLKEMCEMQRQMSGRANGSGHQEDSRELARLGLAARHVQQEVDMSLCHSLQLFAQLPAAAFVMASQMAGAAMANPQVRLLMLNIVVSDYISH